MNVMETHISRDEIGVLLANQHRTSVFHVYCIVHLNFLFSAHTFNVNAKQVPPPGKGSLYLRPLLIGSGPVLGLAPAPECTFLIYASPVRNYFKVSDFFFLSTF